MEPPPLQPRPPEMIAPGATAPPPSAVAVTPDDRTMAMLCHLLAIFTGFLGPLILWLVKKDGSSFVDHHGKESLNFQITFMIVIFGLACVTMVLMLVFIGILLVPVFFVIILGGLVLEIIACIAASEGRWHRYPMSIRFIR